MYNLYLVTDEKLCLGRDLTEVVKMALDGGVTMVQLREKELDSLNFVKRAIELKRILEPYNVPLIINDRVDVALASGADGVHIGQNDIPFHLIKKIIPKNMIIGLSVETMEQAVEAEKLDVDYLGVSPVFSTPTKTNFDENPWGIGGLIQLRKISRHKLVAIGGINSSNAADVIKAGADGVAVVSGICSAPDPAKAARELSKIISESKINDKTL